MQENNLTSKIYKMARAVMAATALPIIIIYIMIAKPDYKIMNAVGHVVVPVAHAVGDLVTWPVRIVGHISRDVHNLSTLRAENEELRAKLEAATMRQNYCDVAILENQKLTREINAGATTPQTAVFADVVYHNNAIHHNTFSINRGTNDGIKNGMVVVSMDKTLVGVIIDVSASHAVVRTLVDAASNIAVRVSGSEVYGFMTGTGGNRPKMGFFSDPEFSAGAGIKLITSNISGVLPNGIFVGTMINDGEVQILSPGTISRVMVLQFDDGNGYK